MSTTVEASAEEGYLLLLLHVPVDIWSEILLRLPVKSLLRFKSVCKKWYHLIKSPSFVSKHLHRSTADGVSPLAFLRRDTLLTLLREDTLSVAADYEVHPPVENELWEGSEIVGSCNGLVVVASTCLPRHRMILWNPATRMFKTLPKPLLSAKKRRQDHWVDLFYGLWSTPENPMDHRLLRIVQVLGNGNDLRYSGTEIYSQASDSWRVVDAEFPTTECILRRPSTSSPAVFLNGNLHWPAYDYGGKRRNTVMAFDTKTEVFQHIPMPDGVKQFYTSLLVYQEGCLGVAKIPRGDDDGGSNDVIDVWVMKEYGIHQSWTKLFSFTYLNYSVSRVQGCWRNGEIIIFCDSEALVLYNPRTRLFRDLPVEGSSCNLTYQESLVPV